ncbi:hypothetical protein B0H17DRAFT_1192893 [Mycena rosella]|uniref:Uncharacterized protein n=1 Tax=Mycena rosella TaxID=1033263 RepID=A0AAD7M960_MYCRO|nr:hypothetical protein B0H17DRAFT_1192893 [Mycena rosella]
MHSILALCILAVLSACARATPIPWDKPAAVSASTGQGGNAPGGSVYGSSADTALLSVLSGNAGNGGDASSSGDAFASDSSRTNSAGSSDVLEGTPFGAGSLVNIITSLGGGHSDNSIL